MRKWILILSVFLFVGCQGKIGSFIDGDANLALVFDKIQKEIIDEGNSLVLWNDVPLSANEIEKLYQLDMTKVEEYLVKTVVVEAQCSEIAFFKVEKEKESYVKDAISYRKDTLKNRWGTTVEEASYLLDNALEGRIGAYYYFVVGSDSEKVVNYIQKMDE